MIRYSALVLLLAGPVAASPDNVITGPLRSGYLTVLTAGVVDGDTLDVGEYRVRLWGINAPEDGQQCDLGHGPVDIGDLATALMEGLVQERQLTCYVRDIDRYDRIVAQCAFDDGSDLASLVVEAGWAWDYPRYSADALVADKESAPGGYYAGEQRRARLNAFGVWGGECVAPWVWRQRELRQK